MIMSLLRQSCLLGPGAANGGTTPGRKENTKLANEVTETQRHSGSLVKTRGNENKTSRLLNKERQTSSSRHPRFSLREMAEGQLVGQVTGQQWQNPLSLKRPCLGLVVYK